MTSVMNEQEMISADADDEPDSPVITLTVPQQFEAEVIIDDRRWLDLVDESQCARLTSAIAACLAAVSPDWAGFSVLLADDAMLAELNKVHRGKQGPTNVLSFPDHEDGLIGDIAIAYETVIAEAADQGKTAADHFLHLVIHGVLHLLGHDHLDDDDANTMEAIEISILAGLDVANPYAEAES